MKTLHQAALSLKTVLFQTRIAIFHLLLRRNGNDTECKLPRHLREYRYETEGSGNIHLEEELCK